MLVVSVYFIGKCDRIKVIHREKKMRRRYFSSACTGQLLVFALLWSGEVFSQPPDPMQEAEQHFEEGVKLFELRKYASALEEFNESYEMFPHWKILYNIGMCYLELGDFPLAATKLSYFIEEGAGRIDEQVLTEVVDTLQELKEKVGMLRLTGDYEGGELEIDGKQDKRGLEGKDVFLKPGVHHVKLVKKGKAVVDKKITVEAGEEKEIFVVQAEAAGGALEAGMETHAPAAGKTEQGEAPEEGPKSKMQTGAWTSLAVSIAAIVTGSVMGGLAIKETNLMKEKEKEYNDKRDTAAENELNAIEKQRDDHYRQGMKYSNASTALFVIGGAAAVATVTLFPLSMKKAGHERKAVLDLYVHGNRAGLILSF
jgi:hypothetical protein